MNVILGSLWDELILCESGIPKNEQVIRAQQAPGGRGERQRGWDGGAGGRVRGARAAGEGAEARRRRGRPGSEDQPSERSGAGGFAPSTMLHGPNSGPRPTAVDRPPHPGSGFRNIIYSNIMRSARSQAPSTLPRSTATHMQFTVPCVNGQTWELGNSDSTEPEGPCSHLGPLAAPC